MSRCIRVTAGKSPPLKNLGKTVLRLLCIDTDIFTKKEIYNIVLQAIIDRFTAIKGIVNTFFWSELKINKHSAHPFCTPGVYFSPCVYRLLDIFEKALFYTNLT